MRSYLVLLLLFLFQSCRQTDVEVASGDLPAKIEIDLTEYQEISFKEFIDQAALIELELTSMSGIDVINKVVSTEHAIFIFNEIENALEKSIVKFDNSGNFLNRWNAQDDGPGNFQYLSDFVVANDTILEILDRVQNSIISFSAKGSYLDRRKIDLQAFKFARFVNGNLLCYRGNAVQYDPVLNSTKNLIFVDQDGKITGKSHVQIQKPLEDNFLSLGEFFFPMPDENSYFFTDVLNDTLFFCNAEQVLPKYILAFSNNSYKEKKLSELEKEKKEGLNPDLYSFEVLNTLNDPEIISKIETILPSDDGFLAFFRYHRNHYFVRYNANTKEQKLFRLDHPMVWPIWYAGPNEIMLVVTSPMNFKSKLAQKPIAELQDLHDKINENSNPFIFKIDMSRYR